MEKFHIRDITIPRDGATVMRDRYWACIDGDPKKALFWGKARLPQCNKNEKLLAIAPNFEPIQNVKIIFVPIAYNTTHYKHTV